jgi:transcriptional regulator with XRE-family HTH domain
MPRRSKAADALPPVVEQAVARLGSDIALARRRRRIAQDAMAQRMQVSRQTLHRLEHGDRSISLSVLASALHVLGLASRLGQLAAADQDATALDVDLHHVPQRIRAPSRGPSS